MSTTCQIDFEDNSVKVFYPGELLRGIVRIKLLEETFVRSIHIDIHGEAYTNWVTFSNTYECDEQYMNERTYFEGGSEIQMMPGLYSYIFQCMLPAHLPTSVEGKYGYIRYTATVVIEFSKRPVKTFVEPFTVIRKTDWNTLVALRKPSVAGISDVFYLCGFLCCISNTVKIFARTHFAGYSPGQTINLQFNVNNKSGQRFRRFRVKLIRQIIYYKSRHSMKKKLETSALVTQKTDGCAGFEDRDFYVNLEVPSTPPTDVLQSKIIKVRYWIRITGFVRPWHYNLVLDCPISIISYPLQDNIRKQRLQSMETLNTMCSSQRSLAIPSISSTLLNDDYLKHSSGLMPPDQIARQLSTVASSSQSLLNEDIPPTYEEAIQLKNTAENAFRPRYPMFKHTNFYSMNC